MISSRINDLHIAILENQFDVICSYRGDVITRTSEIINTKLQDMTSDQIDDMNRIIDLSNILYNETSLDVIIDDDTYDILVERYKSLYNETPVGSMKGVRDGSSPISDTSTAPLDLMTKLDRDKYLYSDIIIPPNEKIVRRVPKVDMSYTQNNDSHLTVHDQLYPDLVGTLNKCKYVLAKDAPMDTNNEKVFELDYIAKHLKDGIYNIDRKLSFMLQLKFDGVSVVATIEGNKIIEARSRGDVESNKAADLTSILYGYVFDNAPTNLQGTIGVKFEAIMTYYDLARYNNETGSDYRNCRTAITSIFSKDNGRRYQKYITLVPLDMDTEREYVPLHQKVAFLNKHYANTIKSEAAICSGNYVSALYQTNRFLADADDLRDQSYFMYDGIVFTYLDEDIVDNLGRVGSINQYQMAIKFPADRKTTVFRGYTYTIGKDGRITPIINYDPITFMGTVHTKSSGHSYGRFKELNLKIGDVLNVDYVNDVMPYVYKVKTNNPNPPVEFTSTCPACNSKVAISTSGKSAYCTNADCIGRGIKRLAGFFESLNIKDFNESYLDRLGLSYVSDVYNMPVAELTRRFSSSVLADKFKRRLRDGIQDRFDYELVGALGFTSMGFSKWEKILRHIPLDKLCEIIDANPAEAVNTISNIRGIGSTTAITVVEEFPMFRKDIEFIRGLPHKQIAKSAIRKSVRFTGVRDSHFVDYLNSIGFDASGSAGLNKNTDILVVPYDGYTSSKTDKAKANDTMIISILDMKENASVYL